uniref:YTH domain-containing protein n=1 Tax=Aplanochytrium stocchinoi TaxID=215587 RepID=A0A7S3PH09_9STRA
MSGEGRPNAWGKPPQMPAAPAVESQPPQPPPPAPNAWGNPSQAVTSNPAAPEPSANTIAQAQNVSVHTQGRAQAKVQAQAHVEQRKSTKLSDDSNKATKPKMNVGVGAKSWAEIARDPNTQTPLTAVETGQAEENSNIRQQAYKGSVNNANVDPSAPENKHSINNNYNNNQEPQHHSHSQHHQQSYGGHRGRGGRWNNNRVNPNARSSPMNRPAGRRGLTFGDLQNQSQQLMMVQRLVASANQMRVDPNFLYQAQMQQYAAFYGNYVPQNYITPGSVPLDENSYAHLQLLRMYPHLVAINQTQVMANPPHAKYIVYRIDNELEGHHGIKYNLINIEEQFAPMLNRALGEASGLGPVYIFFIFPQARRCIGVAEMISAAVRKPEGDTGASRSDDDTEADPDDGQVSVENTRDEKSNVPSDNSNNKTKKDMVVQVRWICVKDIHLGAFKRARMLLPPVSMQSLQQALPSEDSKGAGADADANTEDEGKEKRKGIYEDPPDMYLLDSTAGPTALQIMLEQHATSTMLLDLKMFDEAEANNGVMPPYYKSGVSTHTFQHNRYSNSNYQRGGYQGRGRGGYRGRGVQTSGPGYRGDKGSNFEKSNSLNAGYRGGRRGRGDLSDTGGRGMLQ